MELVKLEVDKFDINIIAGLIYETDVDLFNLYFNNKQNAVNKIEKMIENGNNSLGYENIRVIKGSQQEIVGILVSYKGGKKLKRDIMSYFQVLHVWDSLKFILLDINDKLICSKLNKDDFYIAKVAVAPESRGKGIGTFILEKAIKIAREKNAFRAVLDVDLENKGALKLYTRFGFKEFGKRQIHWLGGKNGVYHMEYRLK